MDVPLLISKTRSILSYIFHYFLVSFHMLPLSINKVPCCIQYIWFKFTISSIYFQKQYRDHKDSSSIVLNEIFNGIKVLKLYAWERSFEKKVGDIRQKEMLELTKIRILGSLGRFLWESTPQLVSFFYTYCWIYKNIISKRYIILFFAITIYYSKI